MSNWESRAAQTFAGADIGGTMQLFVRRGVRARCAVAVCTIIAVMVMGAMPVSAAINLNDWVGYWTGTGKVVLTNGATESVKCVVTYKVNGTQLRQSLRCAGQGFSLNGTADLQIASGGAVTGSWTETTYAATGDVKGRTTDRGFSLAITGPAFTAVMDASTTACRQTLDIIPTGLGVSKISLGLGKC